ncbi:MAG: hypothetical protein GEU89_15910 [Kiloniellaceae bacterium]|nr:hypothetical protein [Kiloniellaceae bacterium]
MSPVSGHDDGEAASTTEDRAESSLATLARELVDKVGIDGAMRYCRSLGWRGVLDQVENLRSQRS